MERRSSGREGARHVLAKVLLTAIFHGVFVAAVVVPFGWDAMNALVEVAIIAASVTIAIYTVEWGRDNVQ